MIQTQLLRLEPPYQIICAAGELGIQVATLIVTEEKTTPEGGYSIDTHSHPVVNYGLKQLAGRIMKETPDDWTSFACLKPEGAVWNKVEIADVQIVGLAGVKKDISLEEFCWLVPRTDMDGDDPDDCVWDRESADSIFRLHFQLQSMGLSPRPISADVLQSDGEGRIIVELSLGDSAAVPRMVYVGFKYSGSADMDAWFFRIPLYTQDMDECVGSLVTATIGLATMFLPGTAIIFSHSDDSREKTLDDLVERANRQLRMTV